MPSALRICAMSGLPEKYSFGETRPSARSKNSNVPPTLAASLKLSRLRVRKFGVGFSLMAGQLELAAGAVRFSRLRPGTEADTLCCGSLVPCWNYRGKAVVFYFATIKVQVVPAAQRLFSTIN